MKIVKGKRTKRPSTYSPIPHGGVYFSDQISVHTEEEEDMANCLILLAQGFNSNHVKEDNESEEESRRRSEKLSHKKRYRESDSIASGSTQSYVYNCKTCNRTFQSLQALGGHRASHRRPQKDFREEKYVKREKNPGQVSNYRLPNRAVFTPLAIKANKMHECSICGSEFSTGQALGGHMRRHRVAPLAKTEGESHEEIQDHKTTNILSFDLNLQAPIEDGQNQVVELTFGFRHKNSLVFAGPALVGCHFWK